MKTISVTKEEIKYLLEKSFEEGYSGYLDLKNEVVSDIINEFLINKELKMPDLSKDASQPFSSYPLSLSDIYLNNIQLSTTTTTTENYSDLI